jgi:gluconate 2-dehydrogenase alpha chain
MPGNIDAIIVGLGASGGILAKQLTEAGLRVLALEKGNLYQPFDEEFRFKHDELRYWKRLAISPGMTTDPLTWRPDEASDAILLPWALGSHKIGPLFLPPALGSGGGSIHWAAWAWRFRASEFRMRSTLVERFGDEALPEGNTIVDWPLSYDDLEPYYDRVEWEQGVSGKAGNIKGQIKEGGNPFESPRSRDYPMPPLQPGAGDQRFAKVCEKLGYHPFPAPAGIATVDFNGRKACTYCGFCRDYPCHVEAKTSTHVTSLPAAFDTGNLEVRPYSRVFRVNRSAGRVSGVSYLDVQGNAHEVEAPIVILAAYALENTRLLLVSGINKNGEVGKHFMTHNYGWFVSVLDEETNPFMGPAVASSVIDDTTSEMVPDDADVLWGSPIIGFTGDVQPLETAQLFIPPRLRKWGQEYKDWLRENYRRLHMMYSQTATFPSERFYCDLDPKVADEWGQPALRITHGWAAEDVKAVEWLQSKKREIADEMEVIEYWEDPMQPPYHLSTHEVGTHRMGDDPGTSVVSRFGEVHECPGLFAVGGGQFPTYGSYNPTETIMALAYLTSDHIAEQGATNRSEGR